MAKIISFKSKFEGKPKKVINPNQIDNVKKISEAEAEALLLELAKRVKW